jgi:AraC family transcriptional regulator
VNAEDIASLDFMVPDKEKQADSLSNRSIIGDSWMLTRTACGKLADLKCHSMRNADFYTVITYLHDSGHHDLCCDQQRLDVPMKLAGTTGIYDRQYDWRSIIQGPLDCVLIHFSKSALSHLAGFAIGQATELLDAPGRVGIVDPALQHLAMAIMPPREQSHSMSERFTEKIIQVVIGHLVCTHGHARTNDAMDRNRLAAWQMRRAREVVELNIRSRISVEDLSNTCRLSPSHFSFLFKRTNGVSPHQWLTACRIEHAKKLLKTTDQAIIDIAFAAGFADQSHFTRVFSQHVMASPSAWRREHKLCEGLLVGA